MAQMPVTRIRSIHEFHRYRGLTEPEHPLISVVNYEDVQLTEMATEKRWIFDFYCISLKRDMVGKIQYGQQQYDFDEGVLFFFAPGQSFTIELDVTASRNKSGWMLLIHPDFLWNTPLAKNLKQYEYFDYTVNEALFLSKKEENTIQCIIDIIKREYHANIDQFSQPIIISLIETLLNYSNRFYHRQFITRKISNHEVLDRLEDLLNAYFNSEDLAQQGMPSVQEVSDRLNLSPNYLSNLLKTLTGQSTRQHIQQKLIDTAKEKLSTSDMPIGQIAYALGFDYPQTFSKLFKSKTQLSPLEFRKSFN
ncbi:MAG: AraC family transcriptional regulator [Crocinitomicaceae bacterium]|nr:AraC family transcriptional regulator [Crocinitomicaceae bacterium]